MAEPSNRPSKVICGVLVWYDDAAGEWTWETASRSWAWPPFRETFRVGSDRHIRTGGATLRGAVGRSLREDDYPGSLYLQAGG